MGAGGESKFTVRRPWEGAGFFGNCLLFVEVRERRPS